MESVKLTRPQAKQVLAITFPEYRGRKIKVEFTDKVWFDDLYWSGGTRAKYVILRSDGSSRLVPTSNPWSDNRNPCVDLPNSVVVVQHLMFCGQDMGITIYAHPSLAPKWLETARL